MRIGELRMEVLREYGLDIPLERLRRYNNMGLFKSRKKRNGYREFKQEEFEDIARTLMLLEVGVKPKDILEGKDIVIKNRVRLLRRITGVLSGA